MFGGGVHADQHPPGADGEQPIGDVLHHRPEIHLAPAQGGIRAAAGGALGGLGALALHRGSEPGEVVLHEVVVRPGLHRCDGRRLVHRAGDEDERDVQAAFLKSGQCFQGVELRHPVVGDDDVPGRGEERVLERIGGVHAVEAHQPALGLERMDDQGRVRLRVLDEKDTKGATAGSRRGSHEAVADLTAAPQGQQGG